MKILGENSLMRIPTLSGIYLQEAYQVLTMKIREKFPPSYFHRGKEVAHSEFYILKQARTFCSS